MSRKSTDDITTRVGRLTYDVIGADVESLEPTSDGTALYVPIIERTDQRAEDGTNEFCQFHTGIIPYTSKGTYVEVKGTPELERLGYVMLTPHIYGHNNASEIIVSLYKISPNAQDLELAQFHLLRMYHCRTNWPKIFKTQLARQSRDAPQDYQQQMFQGAGFGRRDTSRRDAGRARPSSNPMDRAIGAGVGSGSFY